MPKLADHYRVVALDLPGHGKSGLMPAAGGYLDDISAIAAFVAAFLRTLRAEKVAVIGCSLGANTSIALAAMYPELISAIVPLQGAAYTVPLINQAALELLVHPRVSLMHHMADNVASLTGRRSTAAGRQYLEESLAGVNPRALRADLRAYGRCDLRPLLPRILCPVLSVRGTDDWFVPETLIDITVEGLGSCRHVQRVRMQDIGHFPHVEAPDELFDLVAPFLAEHHAKPATQ